MLTFQNPGFTKSDHIICPVQKNFIARLCTYSRVLAHGTEGYVISLQPASTVLYPPPLCACACTPTLTLLYILSHTALLSPFLDCHLVSCCSSITSSVMPPPPLFPSHFLPWLCFLQGPKPGVYLFNHWFTRIAPPLECGL